MQVAQLLAEPHESPQEGAHHHPGVSPLPVTEPGAPAVPPSHIPRRWPLNLPNWHGGDTSHSLSLGAVGFLSSDPQVAGGTCSAPSLHAKYPGLPQFLCSQAPCDETCGQPGAVALYPVRGTVGGGSDSPTQTRAWGRAAQLLQRWVPASLLPVQGTPWLALPQSVRWEGGAWCWGGEGSVAAPVQWRGLGAHSLVLTWSAGHRGEGGGADGGFSPRPL